MNGRMVSGLRHGLTRLFLGAAALHLAVFAPAPPLSAAERAESGRTAISLDRILEEARDNNRELLALRSALEAKARKVRSALAEKSPRLTLKETLGASNQPVMAFMNVLGQERFTPADFARINDPKAAADLHASLQAGVPLYTGGRIERGADMARAGRDAAAFELARKEQETRRDAVAAYWGVLLAEANRALAVKSLDTARAHRKLAEDRYDAGMAVYSDALSAQVRELELEEFVLDAANGEARARENLFFVMGRDGDDGSEIAEADFAETDLGDGPEAWIALALERRPDLKAAEAGREAARHAERLALGGKRPSAMAVGSVDFHGDSLARAAEGDGWFVALAMEWTLFDGGKVRAEAAAARAGTEEMDRRLERLESAVRLQVRQSWRSLQTARERLKTSEMAARQAEESLRIVRDRYESGLSEITPLLDAETAFTQANLRKLKARHDYAAGLEELRFAAGGEPAEGPRGGGDDRAGNDER